MRARPFLVRVEAFGTWLDEPKVFRGLVSLFIALLIVFGTVPVLHALRGHSIKDYELWHQTGQIVLKGVEIYPDYRRQKFDFMYPPPCALFLAPISLLGQIGLVAALVAVNAAAWLASNLLAARLIRGGERRWRALVYLASNFVVAIFVWGNFLLGQPTLLLLAIMLGAFLALRQGHEAGAGALIALATAIKAFPVIAIFYLIYRRYWIATLSLLLFLGALVFAFPAVVRGPARAQNDLHRWADGMLFHYNDKGLAQRAGRSNAWKNQSIFGVANRLLRHVDYDDKYEPHQPVFANLADLRFSTVNAIIAAWALLCGSAFLFVMPPRKKRTPETDTLETALLLLLMLIFTPLSFGYLYAWLLYPAGVITYQLLKRGHTSLAVLSAIAGLLLALTIPFRIGAQTYGNIFFATLLLAIALGLELYRVRRENGLTTNSSADAAGR